MSNFKLTERSTDPDDYDIKSEQWDEEYHKALRAEELKKLLEDIATPYVLAQLAYDEGADITDGATDDEK